MFKNKYLHIYIYVYVFIHICLQITLEELAQCISYHLGHGFVVATATVAFAIKLIVVYISVVEFESVGVALSLKFCLENVVNLF